MDTFDRQVRVSRVIDGDTVILADGEHLRLVGLDTPELDHETGQHEPGAVAAKKALEQQIPGGHSLGLVLAVQTRDNYGRLLGHLFTRERVNVQAVLLSRGLATSLPFPPNLRFAACYQHSSEAALAAGVGLWSLPAYASQPVRSVNAGSRGYRRVHGPLTHMTRNSKGVRLLMNGRLRVVISAADLKYFPAQLLQQLPGSRVEVRGHLYQHNKQLGMRLRHPSNLRVLMDQPSS